MVNQGDIFYVNFDPSRGHEQMRRRPAIALSHDLVRDTSGMTIVAPISSTTRVFPMYHRLISTNHVHGQVLLDQTKALDLSARYVTNADIIEHLSNDEFVTLIAQYKALFTID